MAIDVDPACVMPKAILAAADLRGANVLEVGAADGRLTFQYAAGAASVVAIDTKEPEIREACQRRDDRCGEVRFLAASATALPFRAEQFGLVLLASSL